jgi:hypothetical protein
VLIFPAAALAVIGAGRPEPDEPRVTAPETDHPPTRTGRRRATGSASSSADSQQSASSSAPVRTGPSRPRRTHSDRPAAAQQQVPATRLLQEDS